MAGSLPAALVALGVAAVAFGVPAVRAEEPAASPLRSLALGLSRAGDEKAATAKLERLGAARSPALRLPDEDLDERPPSRLSAATFDLLLSVLAETARRFPAVRPRVRELVLSWTYCGVAAEGGPWDLELQGDAVVRAPAVGPFPAGRRGFDAFGLGPSTAQDPAVVDVLRYRTQAEREALRGAVASACFPDPETAGPIGSVEPGAAPAPGPSPNERPMVGAAPGTSGGFAPAFPVPAVRGLGLRGTLVLASYLDGQVGFNGSLEWTPGSFFFLRGGVGLRVPRAPGPFVYSWGLGYDDWHPGTFSLQLNQWGPTTPDQGMDFPSARLNLGYKLPSLCRHRMCLSTFAYLETRLDWQPDVGLRVTWNLTDTLFLRLGLDYKPLIGRPFEWVYGAGYWDWHAFTWTLRYDNWGPNSVPDSNLARNGVVTVGWSWAL